MRVSFLILSFLLNLNIFIIPTPIKATIFPDKSTTSLWNKIIRYSNSEESFKKRPSICKDFIDKIATSNKPNLVNYYKSKKLYKECHFDLIKFKDNSIYILFSKLIKKGHNKMVYNIIDINNPNKNLVALIDYTDIKKNHGNILREYQITEQFSHLGSILKPYHYDFFPNHHPKPAVISVYDKYENTLQKFANKKTNNLAERWSMIKPIIDDYEQLQNNLIHRDIKFGNIVCKSLPSAGSDEPKHQFTCALVDFEFALFKEEWKENKRITQMLGTTVNMAPELFNRYSLSKHLWSHLIKRESFSFGMILLALFGYRKEYDTCLSFLRQMYNIQKSTDIPTRKKQSKNRENLEIFSKWYAKIDVKKKQNPYSALRSLLLEMVNPNYIHRPDLVKSRDNIDSFLSNHPFLITGHQ